MTASLQKYIFLSQNDNISAVVYGEDCPTGQTSECTGSHAHTHCTGHDFAPSCENQKCTCSYSGCEFISVFIVQYIFGQNFQNNTKSLDPPYRTVFQNNQENQARIISLRFQNLDLSYSTQLNFIKLRSQ